ncbi:TetR/AcrR family transcriptional regulator [Roseimarinus sediminis]|uniref:TetR/AcrR family transcriptional regulator n=1 Tax=Roseimarinus sediminis TaxID=1610899 RepID=UPI003D1C3974
MDRTALSTEDRIINAARETFLKYGYHGTKLQQVAESAKVNKSVIHYYFRTKEKLYKTILREIILLIESTDWTDARTRDVNSNVNWFLFTEMYNNKNLFENTIKELYPNDWRKKQHQIVVLFEIEKIF